MKKFRFTLLCLFTVLILTGAAGPCEPDAQRSTPAKTAGGLVNLVAPGAGDGVAWLVDAGLWCLGIGAGATANHLHNKRKAKKKAAEAAPVKT